MSARLGDRLSAARQRRFVGRDEEVALFESALAAPEPPFHVLYIFGPGGIGKTTLLAQLAQRCSLAAVPAWLLDARTITPDPDSFIGALQRAMDIAPTIDPLHTLAASVRRHVILIDTYELLTPLDTWLRNVFLPELPAHVLVVLAGRDPPILAWRADPGWQALLHTLPLRNLSRTHSRAYLNERGIPPDQHEAVLSFTHGYPLALSLVADLFDQRRLLIFQPDEALDIVRTLLEHLVQRVPGPAHRAALEICALVRLTSEPLLAEMMMIPDVHELFDWLRGLSFISASRQGLFPHDLVREALEADLRWRNPDWYAELHRRARAFYSNRLQRLPPHEQQQTLANYIFLHRNNPVVRPFFEWQTGNTLLADSARAHDIPLLLALVERFEGGESAALARHWFDRQPGATTVIRDPAGHAAGFVLMLELQALSEAEREADAATRCAWHYVQQHAPLRPGEKATLFRFWMAQESYQSVSAVQSLLFIIIVRHYLTTPGLAFTFLPCADADFWAAMFQYADLKRIPSADFTVGGHSYGVYGHDWRSVPPMAWLELLGERELASGQRLADPPPLPKATLVVLSQSDFAAAVRDALRHLTSARALRDNPLLHSRLVSERAGNSAAEAERIAALRQAINQACDGLKASLHDVRSYRALYHTYLQPAPTQEQAAELLNLPFSTFRRHLKSGVEQVIALLWQQEMGEELL